MNWGHKILILYLAFAGFMITLVVLCVMQKDVQLVAPDYYKQELNYQSRMEQTRNAELAGLTLENSKGELLIANANGTGMEGNILFFRPSDANLDRKVALHIPNGQSQRINLSSMKTGLWTLKITFQSQGKACYTEKQIVI